MTDEKVFRPSDKATDKARNERDEAVMLANRVLDRINADPDDDLAILARQFLRMCESVNAAVLLKHYCWTDGDKVPKWAQEHPDYPSNNMVGTGPLRTSRRGHLWGRIPERLIPLPADSQGGR